MKAKLKRCVLLIASVLMIAEIVQAQEEKTSFNLDEAINYAMQNSYVLHNTTQDITLAQKKVWETIS